MRRTDRHAAGCREFTRQCSKEAMSTADVAWFFGVLVICFCLFVCILCGAM